MDKNIQKIRKSWAEDPRWQGIERHYGAQDVERLRGSFVVESSLARQGAEKFWKPLASNQLVSALGALTGNQAVQQVQAGLKAIYLSGWQVAADANLSGQMYPDQSLYPSNSVPDVVRRIQSALRRADQIQHSKGRHEIDWFAPIVADAEAGFGGTLNVFELCKQLIEAGAAAIHLEDQLASAKKCGHLGGKVLVPTSEFVQKLQAARLAADVMSVPTLIIARTDALSARLLTSDIDTRDREFIQQAARTVEGFHSVTGGLSMAIARGLAYAPYADLLWCETSSPDLDEARLFAQSIHRHYPGKWLAYNLSPSFNWRKKLSEEQIARFQSQLFRLGYRFQFVTLAGFHTLNHSMFELARDFATRGMPAYAEFQAAEMESERSHGYGAATHQSFVGTGYFDQVSEVISQGASSTLAMEHSTEAEQFRSPQDPFNHAEEYDLADVVRSGLPACDSMLPAARPVMAARKKLPKGAARRSTRGSARMTTDHDKIRSWIEQRGGIPSTVAGTMRGGQAGLLRVDYPGFSGEGRLRAIDWDAFFQKFDEQDLVFLYQDRTASGRESRFSKFVARETVAQKASPRKRRSA